MSSPDWATEVDVIKKIKGIDVSAWQPNLVWSGLRLDGIDFAFIKATESTTYQSKTFVRDWSECKNAGIIRGAYHFFSRSTDARAQAEFFCKVVGPLQFGDLPLVLDWEGTDGSPGEDDLDAALKFLETVEQISGIRPIIYTGPYFFYAMGNERLKKGFEKYPLWLAQYTSGKPWMPKPWTKLHFWQYTDHYRATSYNGNLDGNWFNGTLEELKAMTLGNETALKTPNFSLEESDRNIIAGYASGADVELTTLLKSISRITLANKTTK